MSAGWISIHRELSNCWVSKDKPYNYMAAWVDLLLMANHKDAKILLNGSLVYVERGSFITSKRKLADRWGWSITKVTNFLNMAQTDEMITYKSDSKKTVINIVNYNVYQDCSNNKVTEKEHESKTEVKQEETNNNDKQNNNNDKQIVFDYDGAWIATYAIYPKNRNAASAKTAWMDILLKYPENKHHDIAHYIYLATKKYVEEYKQNNANDEYFKYLPSYDVFLREDCEDFMCKVERESRE